MNINTNINMANKDVLKRVDNRFGPILRTIFILGAIIFPWIVIPNLYQSQELPREVFLFIFSGVFVVLFFLHSLKLGEFQWRRTRLNWILAVCTVIFALWFLYAKNLKIAWEGYPGSYTGGLSEHLAFFAFFLLAIQFFYEAEWKKIVEYILMSVTIVIVFFVLLTVYFENNNILTIDFARTPSLVTAAAGVMALSYWWILKKTETRKRSRAFIMVLTLFFVSSLLDFHISWWMWVVGVATTLFLDLFSRTEIYLREKETQTLGINKESNGFISLLFHGDSKYLFLILLFALSRSLSPIFLGEQKIEFLPFYEFLMDYPLLGQKVLFYLFLNSVVFLFGLYYFWKIKKERSSIILVLSGILAISIGHLLYYSESAIYFLLNWVLLVYAGLTFLRITPEKDYLAFLQPKSKARGTFFIVGLIISVIISGLIILRIGSLF